MRRLARLDLDVLDEVARDPNATTMSIVVASISMGLAGLGGWVWWMTSGLGDVRASDSIFIKSAVFGSIASLALWGVWLVIVAWLLQRLAKTIVEIGPLLRAAGLATVPMAFGIFMVIPVVSFSIGVLAIAGWVLLTQSAIERATGIRGGEVMLANLAGFAVWGLVLSLLSTGDNQFAPGIFLAESLWDLVASAG